MNSLCSIEQEDSLVRAYREIYLDRLGEECFPWSEEDIVYRLCSVPEIYKRVRAIITLEPTDKQRNELILKFLPDPFELDRLFEEYLYVPDEFDDVSENVV